MSSAPLHLFGSLAVRHGILVTEQLQPLIEEQERDGETPLGEIARRRGLLSARQVRYLLDVQRSGAVEAADTAFGALAQHNGFASADEVGIALQAQGKAEAKPPLGEILVGMGTLGLQECGAILIAQRRLRGGADSADLDYETRLLPVVAEPGPPPGHRPEPQGWLIQETGDDLGHVFPLCQRSVLGRLPEQDVPVPDMAASRDHAVIEYLPALLQHVIRDLDSRNGTFVNGAQLIRPRPLQPGDRVQIGATVLRYVTGGGIGGGRTTVVGRLSQDAARAAIRVASRALPLLRGAASAAGSTAHRLLSTPRHKKDQISERRDSLLEQLALACIEANPDAPEALAARLAEQRLVELRRGGEVSVIRWAERRQSESLRQIGRRIVDRGPAPEGWMRVVVEIRELNAELTAV